MGRDWARRLSPADQRDLEVALLEASLRTQSGDEAERTRTQIAALKRLKLDGGTMSKHDDNFRKATRELADAVTPALAELRAFEADVAEAEKRGTPYSPSYVSGSRKNILQRVSLGDGNARAAFRAYREAALVEARALRAAAEAEREPAARMADEMERARLVASATNAEAFAERAKGLLDAGQPHRAALMLAVAQDKGWRGGVRIDPATGAPVGVADELRRDIEEALDVADPKRAEAKAIESAVAANAAEFERQRVGLLSTYGVGVTDDGGLGRGHPSQVARASLALKAAAIRAADETGEPYREPEGALASVPSDVYVQARE